MSEAAGKLLGVLGSLAAAVGIGALFKSIAESALQSAVNIDKQRQTLIALTGSAATAEQKLSELRALARKSPGVTTTFATDLFNQLKAIGNIAEPTIDKVIKSVGKLNAVFTIDDPQTFSRNLVQIFSGNFEKDQIKEAATRVPIFNQILQQAFGTSNPDALRKLQAAGKLTLNTYLEGLSNAVENDPRFKNIQESIGSKFEKTKDRIQVALGPLGDALSRILLPLFDDLTRATEKYAPIAAKAFSDNRTEIIETARQLGNLVLDVGRLIMKIGEIGQSLGVFKSFKEEIRQTALLLATVRDLANLDFGGTRIRTLAEQFANQDAAEARRNRVIGPGGITQGRIADLFNQVVLGPPIIKTPPGAGGGDASSSNISAGAAKKAESEARQLREAQFETEKTRAEGLVELLKQERDNRLQLLQEQYDKGIILTKEFYEKKLKIAISNIDAEFALLVIEQTKLIDDESIVKGLEKEKIQKRLAEIYTQQQFKILQLTKVERDNFAEFKEKLGPLETLDPSRSQLTVKPVESPLIIQERERLRALTAASEAFGRLQANLDAAWVRMATGRSLQWRIQRAFWVDGLPSFLCHDGPEWANPENHKLPQELIEQDLAFAPVCEERNRNLLRSWLPIWIVSAHFKFPTGVHHVDVRCSAENPLFSIAIF